MNIQKTVRKIALYTVATIFASTALITPLLAEVTSCSSSKSAASIRTLIATAWCLIDEAPVKSAISNGNKKLVSRFICKRNRVLAAIKDTLKNRTVPSVKELETINQWIHKLHSLAVKSDIFEKNSVEMVLFTGNMTVANGYIDCALFMACGNNELVLD